MESVILGGWLPDPPDPKDSSFRDFKGRLTPRATESEHILPTPTPVSNQGRLLSCTANVTADALEILMAQSGAVVQLSRLFIYFNARNYHGATNKDGGSYLRMTFEAVKRLGVCPESMWGYVLGNVNLRPPLKAYHAANDNKVTEFYRINAAADERPDDIETALRSGHPVAFGTQVGPELTSYKGETDAAFGAPSTFEGRHAMLICGVRRRGGRREFWIRNSWGAEWGLGGYAWFDESYIRWGQSSDFWVPTRMPELA
ncbi:MAG: C1 family peptidase [Polyangiaceae bacterium]|nr:C1 family peptidase [Polyangiaceae bacterium]